MIAQQTSPALPFALRLTQTGMNALGRVAPPLAGRWALDLFFTPVRFKEPQREAELVQQAEIFNVPFGDSHLVAYSWGEGPPVLLVHGWSGRGAQLGSFVEPLVKAGHRVVAFDSPAHGRTPGRRTTAIEVAAAIHRMGVVLGPLSAVVAHSFGAVCTTLALRDGLAAERIVYLAPACHVKAAVRGFARQFGLSWPVEYGLRGEMEKSFGPGIWHDLSASTVARGLKIPALILHDIDDLEVPHAEGVSLAHAWPGARLITTAGLGHRRILRDKKVVEQGVEFIAAL